MKHVARSLALAAASVLSCAALTCSAAALTAPAGGPMAPAAAQAPQGMGQYGMPMPNNTVSQPPTYGPSPTFDQMQRGAWFDGARAAKRAHARHASMEPSHAAKFQHPPVASDYVGRYQDAFRQGYDSWERHNGMAPPPSPPTGM